MPKDHDHRPYILLGLILGGAVIGRGRVTAEGVETLVVEDSLVNSYALPTLMSVQH